MHRLLLATALVSLLPFGAVSQTGAEAPAILISDALKIEGKTRLVATGNVEALQGERRLKAARVIYDREKDTLTLEGPITLTEGEDVIVLADAGELSADLRDGLLIGARMIFDRQTQLAAQSIDRIGGRYTQLYQVAATSCRVCGADTPPLWQIRAKRVIHDQAEQQLYFDSATLQILDVPVFWLPRLRLPDPTLARASGFLIPQLRQNSDLGLGLKVPYFLRIGDHKDLTLTPYLSPHTRTLEWRYRQAFTAGDILFNGALSDDDLRHGAGRIWFEGNGRFDLANDWKLTFDIEAVSDKAYAVEYSYTDKDRLDSELAFTRVKRNSYSRASIIGYQTLRDTELNSTIPSIVGDGIHEQRLFPAGIGGEIRVTAEAHSHYRYSNTDITGRDLSRMNAGAEWLRGWTFGPGLQAQTTLGVSVDSFWVNQDTTSPNHEAEATPYGSLTLRWPWMRQTAQATHIIEPAVMLGWVGGSVSRHPNEESTRVEFDEGNLLSLSRFPAADRRDRGQSLAYGLNWTRQGSDGWRSSLSLGQVFHDVAHPDFSRSSGLAGLSSDVLLAAQFRHAKGLDFTLRTLIDAGRTGGSKAEARTAFDRPRYGLYASYVWLGQDATEARAADISEWTLDGHWRMGRHWRAKTNWRYDVASDQTAEAGLGLQFKNECVEVNLTASRRFTSSTIVAPSTDFGFTVSLGGFSAKTRDTSYTKTCHN